jgi:CBS domain-containing protein
VRLSQIMTRRPLVVTPEVPPSELRRLVDAARVRHLPLMDGDRLVGLWLATEEGAMVLLGPESVHQTHPDADAEEAVREIVAGSEAAVAFEEGRPVGMLTRTDVLGIVRTALAHGVARPAENPVVVVLTGDAGAGKSTLLLRTIPLLRECEAGVVRADGPAGSAPVRTELGGVPAINDPAAAFRRGLHDSVRALGDVQVVLVEDRDRRPGERGVPGGDVQVAVVPAPDLPALDAADVREAQAVVVTRMDEAPAALDLPAQTARLRAASPDLAVFATAAAVDDRDLDAWRDWLLGRVLPRGHR